MPTEKIADLPTALRCRDPNHLAATMVVRPPGRYLHTCPGCGASYEFVVRAPVWCAR